MVSRGADRRLPRSPNDKLMPFQDLPIKRKVMAVIMLTAVIALLLSTAAFALYDVVAYRKGLINNLASTARFLARHSSVTLLGADQREAASLLGALRAVPDVASAALYDSDGKLFASYLAPDELSSLPSNPGAAGYQFAHGRLSLFTPIVVDGRRAGTLYLRSRNRALEQRVGSFLPIAAGVFAGSVLIALALSRALQRRITGPILALAGAAKAVSQKGDLSVRVPAEPNDELGSLAASFNEMLARIAAAERARSFLAAIVESSDAAIIGKDMEGKVVSWNAGAERMFGYTAAEMIGQSILGLLSPDRLHEEPRMLMEVRQGATRHYETVRLRKDGTPLEVSLITSPIRSPAGEIIGVSSIARDITNTKRAERQLQESRARLAGIIGSAMDAIISVDAEQRVRLFNAAAERMFRCDAARAVGRPLDDFIPQRFRAAHHQDVEEFGRTGTTSRAMGHLRPLSALRADGGEFPIEASISQVEVGGQKIYTVILRDITERQRAQEEIRRMNLELEDRVRARTAELTAANRELEAFTYSVAHDLRAPLRHIDAFSRILNEEYAANLPEEAQRYLRTISTGSRHMSQLVDDLLNLARVGRRELQRDCVGLDQVVQEVLQGLKTDATGREIEWRIHPLPTIECDPGLIKQVFTNLLANALKYTRPRPRAVIEIGALDSNGDATIFVRDNGVGFNMKYADKLFGVFQRLHRAEEFEGTGVGLATVERIVRKHGGCVWAEGAVDKGAAFYFTIPKTKNRSVPDAPLTE